MTQIPIVTNPQVIPRARFRAWDTLKKKMYDVLTLKSPGTACVVQQIGAHHQEFWAADYQAKIVLLQYTGVQDANGDALFEGDVVQVREVEGRAGQEGVVMWDAMGAWLLMFSKPDKNDSFVDMLYPLARATIRLRSRFEPGPVAESTGPAPPG